MGWREVTVYNERKEFVELALKDGGNFSELCRRFGISRKTGYKFLSRYEQQGEAGLYDRSRRPQSSPERTSEEIEGLILGLRGRHPSWGGRKLRRRLEDIGYTGIPSASTITAILRRSGSIREEECDKHRAWNRFEAENPNDLWQMDFKGHFASKESRCHPLTVVDDNSRYSLCVGACEDERAETVEQHLRGVFRKYGMPWAMLMDNGGPWAGGKAREHTCLTVWLIRLGIGVVHSRPYHPQTLGKDERFHRTMKAEVVGRCVGKTIAQCQSLFDHWRVIYNTERPHEALGMQVPAKCYKSSKRSFPENLPEIEYSPSDHIRKVQYGGILHFMGKEFRVGKAFWGQPVALRPTDQDGAFDVFFCNHNIAQISLV